MVSKVFGFISEEAKRQKEVLEMIPSENYTSADVMRATGSVLTNKYSEGYPHKRYYQGNNVIDKVEDYAIDLAKKLFKVPHVNVQPYSGSPANTAVYFALMEPFKDKIMGLSLAFGGHLTHGSPVSISGKYFPVVSYHVGEDGYLDYDEIEKLALKEKPKIIVCGFTAYSRIIDFKRFASIADKVGAYLFADISHITGLVIAGVHPPPTPFVHIIMTNDPALAKKIDRAVFPGLQGGPHDNTTAGIAVALEEAGTPAFKKYGTQIVKNAKALEKQLLKNGFNIVSGGTDNHLILIDLQNKNVNGAVAALALEVAGVVLNKNAVPNDPMPPFYPSGIRMGTPALTTRGMKEKDMVKVANWIKEVVDEVGGLKMPKDKEERSIFWKSFRKEVVKNQKLLKIAEEIKKFAGKFPVPGIQ